MLSKILSKHSIDYSSETIDIMRLSRSENVGPKTFYSLISYYGSAEKALEAIPEMARRGGKSKPIKIFGKAEAQKECEQLTKINAKLLTYKDPHYSLLLKQIHDAPPIISYLGNINLMTKNSLAIVGARNASIAGRQFTSQIAKELRHHNYIITSGLARGIDTAAHLAAGADNTIAVLAGGIDHIYPPENEKLYKSITAEGGLIIAELAIGSVPLGRHFPQRNRIISGLSIATIVVEAGLKSGSLITAKFALEQNREVFAVPGFPLDPRCQGSNKLIKEGAHLLESVDDILNNLTPVHNFLNDNNDKDLYTQPLAKIVDINLLNDKTRTKVVELLSSYPITTEVLATEADLPLSIIFTIILELELAGKITRYPGNKIALKFE